MSVIRSLLKFRFKSLHIPGSCTYSSQSKVSSIQLSVDACPQGIQGNFNFSGCISSDTNCPIYKQWLDNCKRYGLSNCEDQLQGIQTGEKTASQVLADQEHLITELLEKYEITHKDRVSSMQGLQDQASAFPDINSPCPQGVQGEDCVQFKLWLENCYKFGYQNCLQEYQKFKAGKKNLNQIFAEQEKDIREAAILIAYQRKSKHLRNYSTSTSSTSSTTKDSSNNCACKHLEKQEKGQSSQKDKLKRAVKEYGSTVIVFHVSLALTSLGFFYLLVSSGVDVVGLMRSAGIGESILQSKLAAGTSTFVVAYAVHKVFAPVRIATTLTATPLIVRYLRKVGFLKPKGPPPSSA